MISFSCHEQTVTLGAGQHFSRSRPDGFRDTASSDLLALVAEIDAGTPWRDAVRDRYAASKPWLYQIVTDPIRTAFFGPVLPDGDGLVLDIGAGWGQIARPMATRRPVVALEPVAERMAFIRAAARQENLDNRMAFLEADYLESEFTTRFAAICVIGVFEWVGAFQNHTDPQERQRQFLRKARRDLEPGGSLILGIENRLGLKYLLGCPDDHLGVPHVASLPAPLARKRWAGAGHSLQSFTYSLTELDQLLRAAGFTQVEFFGAFPDYKLPRAIVPLAGHGKELSAWLATQQLPVEHNGYDGSTLDAVMQASLVSRYAELAAAGIAHHFVPSFFVRAS